MELPIGLIQRKWRSATRTANGIIRDRDNLSVHELVLLGDELIKILERHAGRIDKLETKVGRLQDRTGAVS